MSGGDRWHEIDDVFRGALALPEPDRRGYVDRACGGDPELREAVRELLAAAREASPFLDAPLDEVRHLRWERIFPPRTGDGTP